MQSAASSIQKFNKVLEDLPGWALPVFVAASIVTASLAYLWPSYVEFPMDDAYIHFVYAQNLAQHGQLIFSFPNEVGVGTSSILWVLLLAAGFKAGISMHLSAKILGVASLIVVGIGLYSLLDRFWQKWQVLLVVLLVTLTGNMLWFALNGMETMIFLALGMTALLLYRAGRWGWLGLALGFLALARPEGICLAAAIALLDLWSHRRIRHGLLLAGALAVLICAPWFIYLKLRTGNFLPTSAVGKQFTTLVAINYVVTRFHLPGLLAQAPSLLYPFLWITYLLEFALGGIFLPPPTIPIGSGDGNLSVRISLWAIPATILVVWLAYQSGKRFFTAQRWRNWIPTVDTRAILVLVLWVALHNLLYMFFLPTPGTASRYGAVNYILLWVAIVAGLSALAARPRLQMAAILGVLFIGACNTIYWNRVYDANIDHMLKVRIAAADYVRDQLPPQERCAAFDIGALRYFSGRPILEVAALINPEANKLVNTGKVDQYLAQNGITCVLLPGRMGDAGDGLFDLASMLKINTSPLFDMELLKVYEIDHDHWLLGYLPTGNYQASVTIYHLRYK